MWGTQHYVVIGLKGPNTRDSKELPLQVHLGEIPLSGPREGPLVDAL